MYLVTAEEMRELDRYTIEQIGIPSFVLMENAGRAVAHYAKQAEGSVIDAGRKARWAVLVGKGNNGGDGIVAARHLREWGGEADIITAVSPAALGGDAALQMKIADNLGIPVRLYEPDTIDWSKYTGVIDALLGTGASGAPRGAYAALIAEANGSGLPILAVDIPSGLEADNGQVHSPCIKARQTVTLAVMKRGLAVHPGAAYAGEIIVAPIGIPPALCDRFKAQTFLADRRMLAERFALELPLPRQADSHKGTYGHVLAIAGSRDMSGAGMLCAKAALRAGCGLVTWALPASLAGQMSGRVPEIMLKGMPDQGTGLWQADDLAELLRLAEGKEAAVIGPGLSRFAGDRAWLRSLWEQARIPLVIDADALNMMADDLRRGEWPAGSPGIVLTPHPGEMARLTGLTVRDVQRDRIQCARRYAEEHRTVLVLKGAGTVIAAPNGHAYVHPGGNPGMATGGMGDVLAGIIASLLAQGCDAETSAVLGVAMHNEAGDRAAQKRPSPNSLIASDLIEEL